MVSPELLDRSAPDAVAPAGPRRAAPGDGLLRWVPAASALAVLAALLLRSGTAPLDILRFAAYALLAVTLPGTLVYRALRRHPHTFVEDVALGAAVGLTLELAAWAALSALDLRPYSWLWPAAVYLPFLAVPRLRRHWRPRAYPEQTGWGWAWSVAAVVIFFSSYLFVVFLDRNPILPTGEDTRQYLDLAYQLSLAGEASNHFPLHLPQAAAEPLNYHWFGYAHMAMAGRVAGVDLTVVSLRLAVPALCAAAIVLTAVVARRVSGRPYAGVAAAVLMWVVGEINFTDPVTQPFGTFTMFVVWHGMSITYSWVLLIALIAVLADGLTAPAQAGAPRIGLPGAYVLTGLLALAASGAKASVLPVTLGAMALTGLVLLITRRRVPWHVVGLGAVLGAAQLFATAVLFRFQTYGLEFDPFDNVMRFWRAPNDRGLPEAVAAVLVFLAFGLNILVKYLGALPLLRRQRWRLEPAQLLLVGGALAGPALYLSFASDNAQYFTRAGVTFGVLLAGWGWADLAARTPLSGRAKAALTAAAVSYAAVLTAVQLDWAEGEHGGGLDRLMPILTWSAVLAAAGAVAACLWPLVRRAHPGLRGTGALVALSAVLLAGAPGYAMDVAKSLRTPNGGAYFTVELPRSRVDAARWIREHSNPEDVLATNDHCLNRPKPGTGCDARSFWLSAYAEREVLVESWGFAPRRFTVPNEGFWDLDLLKRNDAAFADPTPAGLAQLKALGVRWLVVDRDVSAESPTLATLADLRFDNGRLAVYRLR
ncbi:hypothetical protein Cs7R123_19190 [Catellatospora sp. TT07R-123]|uniref:hypothetical protein n=1 Tax=Catellatospora sp. TT07R-123 TaxID=2733863 RepID=UPI001B1BADFC|nr:hypothetical protein [Catellatospora sp. TT07R-123]GHJ44577.1 hypothetical protein Cs7R123_19190 [Catellatospora sp. TT07R-123]